MRILRNSQVEWKVACPRCNAVLAYTDDDVGYCGMEVRIVVCPCGGQIEVSEFAEQRTPLTLFEACSRWEKPE